MNRPYSREAFLSLVEEIRCILPGCSLSTDVITGFCGETEQEHQETVELIREIGFDHAFMYLFSMRENTYAWTHYHDDVPMDVKKRRLTEIQNAFYEKLKTKLPALEGTVELVLVEGESKRSKPGAVQLCGRGEKDRMCVFDGKVVLWAINRYSSS